MPRNGDGRFVSLSGAVASGVVLFALMVVRGLLLWIVLPIAAASWLVAVVPCLVLRLMGVRAPISLRAYLAFGTQVLDATISRLPLGIEPVPWPWHGLTTNDAGISGAF